MQIIKLGTVPIMVVVMGYFLFPLIAFSDTQHPRGMKDDGVYEQKMTLEQLKIKKVILAYGETVKSGNLEAMASFLAADNFSVVEGQYVNWNWQDYRDNHLIPEFENEKFKLLDYKMSNISIGEGHMLSYAVFEFELTYELDGEKKVKKGMGTAILVNRKGDWLIRHIHTS